VEKYSPGASVDSDFYHICDYCEMDDGRPVAVFHVLPERSGHFAICDSCIAKLYMDYVAPAYKQTESIVVKRKAISEKLRNKIFGRDGNKCVKCGSQTNLQVDHIIPFVAGGMTIKSNLQTLCRKCNISKGSKC